MKDKALAICKAKSGYKLEKYTPWSTVRLASGGPNNLFTSEKIIEKTKPWWCTVAGQERTSEVQLGCKEKLFHKDKESKSEIGC